MKAAVLHGNEDIRYEEFPTPETLPGTVKVRVRATGICGSDVPRVLHHGAHFYPVVLGHEYSGEVMEVGQGVTGFAVGDHVTIDPNIYCGHCQYCQNGKKQLCETMEAIGVTRDGGFAEYSLIPAAQAFKLAPSVPFEAAAMAEPLACCLHGIDRAQIRTGDTVLVIKAFYGG